MSGKIADITEQLRHWVKNHVLIISALSTAGVGLIVLRRWFAGGVCRSAARLDGKTVIVTGANTGIGKETAKDLARRGARVILACRDVLKAERAREEIIKTSSNNNVHIQQLDLSSLESVRRFAERINREEKQLSILINNAGVMRCPEWKTVEGFEYQFGVNHLAHFLLTNLLLDKLKRSQPARVVNVSSLAYKRVGKEGLDLDNLNFENKAYDSGIAYGQSKMANLLFTQELSRKLKGSGVTANSLHPGVIRTELGRHFWPEIPLWRKIVAVPLILLIFKSAKQGAQTTIYCAVSEDLEGVSGKYFGDCRMKELPAYAEDGEKARKLWDMSEKMVGLTQ